MRDRELPRRCCHQYVMNTIWTKHAHVCKMCLWGRRKRRKRRRRSRRLTPFSLLFVLLTLYSSYHCPSNISILWFHTTHAHQNSQCRTTDGYYMPSSPAPPRGGEPGFGSTRSTQFINVQSTDHTEARWKIILRCLHGDLLSSCTWFITLLSCLGRHYCGIWKMVVLWAFLWLNVNTSLQTLYVTLNDSLFDLYMYLIIATQEKRNLDSSNLYNEL